MKISLAFSTCPNDTFTFDALVNKRITTSGIEWSVTLADIHHLNQMAVNAEADMIKISYHTLAKVQANYDLLDAGSALGFGCGPLLVTMPGKDLHTLQKENARIAIPGSRTTANLLLSIFAPRLSNKTEMLFHEIVPAVKEGRADAGLIIHENRFTYASEGLICLADLGEFWEKKTGLPVPLGAIAVKKSLPDDIKLRLAALMKESVEYAFAHPLASKEFVQKHAQEMDEEVIQAHIRLYVNEYSKSLGEKGKEAVLRLMEEGEYAGFFEPGTKLGFRGPILPQTANV